MLRILIVDDEHIIRKGLCKIIQREDGLEILGEATNGKEALAIIRAQKPDVVITDIKMPDMDGIELVKRLELEYPEIKTIVISGFEEFHIVRETLKSGALDYLLKPIDNQHLIKILKDTANNLALEISEKKNAQNKEEKFKESLPILQDQVLRNIITDNIPDLDNAVQKLIDLGVDYEFSMELLNRLIMVRLDNYAILTQKDGNADAKSMLLLMKDQLYEILKSNFPFLLCAFENHLVTLLPNLEDEKLDALTSDIFSKLQNAVQSSITLYVTATFKGLSQISPWYNHVKTLTQKSIFPTGTIIKCLDAISDDINPISFKKEMSAIVENYHQKIKTCFETGNNQLLDAIIFETVEKALSYEFTRHDMMRLFTEIHIRLQIAIPDLDKWINGIHGSDYSYTYEISLYDTLDALKDFVINFYDELIKKSFHISG